jgi:hypothetical protein
MLDVYPSDIMSDRAVIRASWQRVALSRAICIELNQQVAESRKLLQQSQRILAKSRVTCRSDRRASPVGERRDQRCCRVHATTISTVRGDSILFGERCGNEPGSLRIPYAHSVLSERIEDGTSVATSGGTPMRERWPAWLVEIGFRLGSVFLIGLIYAAIALALWEAWQEF